jgi:KDO2-lipid IV(A) lauroyltransferase
LRTQLEYLAARFVLASLAVLPLRTAHTLSRCYVRLFALAVPKLTRTAFRNLELALPQSSPAERRRIVDGSFHSIARLLVSLSRFSRLTPQNISQHIRYEGFEHFETARSRGNGVLFATAHLGNWELSAVAHALMTGPMHVVVRPLDNPGINRMIERLRTCTGNTITGKRDFVRPILRALRGNEAVGILIDQNTSADEGVFIDFFGIPACVDKGFARIAAHSGAAIIPGFALWSEQENRYVLRFYAPIYAEGDLQRDTQRVHAALESVIRQYPDQWLWMHRRWKTRPPGSPPVY